MLDQKYIEGRVQSKETCFIKSNKKNHFSSSIKPEINL